LYSHCSLPYTIGKTTRCVSKGGVCNPHVCVFVFRIHADAYPSGHPIIRGNGVTLLPMYLYFIVNTLVDFTSERMML